MWYIDTTRIYVQEFASTDQQILARLQPLSGATIHQIFGYESPILKVKGVIVGDTDRDAIRGMARDGSTHDLDLDTVVVIGSALVHNVTCTRKPTNYQTMRPDLDCDAPVYDCDLELYVDE